MSPNATTPPHLTPTQLKILDVLLSRHSISKASLERMMYGEALISDSLMKVHICNLRRKLKPFGIMIYSKYSGGYWLTEQGKEALRALYRQEEAA